MSEEATKHLGISLFDGVGLSSSRKPISRGEVGRIECSVALKASQGRRSWHDITTGRCILHIIPIPIPLLLAAFSPSFVAAENENLNRPRRKIVSQIDRYEENVEGEGRRGLDSTFSRVIVRKQEETNPLKRESQSSGVSQPHFPGEQ